jgi:hypothetical protein
MPTSRFAVTIDFDADGLRVTLPSRKLAVAGASARTGSRRFEELGLT